MTSIAESLTLLKVDPEIDKALAPLAEFERLFVLQKVREEVAFHLYYQVQEWCASELTKSEPDMAAIERRAASARLLKALADKRDY